MKGKRQRTMAGKEFLQAAKTEVLSHPVMTHPFWARFERGEMSSEGLKRFAIHYYHHVLRTRLYDAMVLARATDEALQAALARILWDEYGLGDLDRTHPAQFRRLLKALGLHEADWTAVTLLPEFEAYTDIHTRLCSDADVWVGAGVVGLAMEYPIPPLYKRLVRGFRKLRVPESGLEFFLEHIPTDEVHASVVENALLPYLDAEPIQAAIRLGMRRSMDARKLLMDGLERVTFETR